MDEKEKNELCETAEKAEETDSGSNGTAIGMCLGLALGTAVGAASGNLALWMPIGLACGLGLGFALDARRKKAAPSPEKTDADESADQTR